jgi:hypothetical protein
VIGTYPPSIFGLGGLFTTIVLLVFSFNDRASRRNPPLLLGAALARAEHQSRCALYAVLLVVGT